MRRERRVQWKPRPSPLTLTPLPRGERGAGAAKLCPPLPACMVLGHPEQVCEDIPNTWSTFGVEVADALWEIKDGREEGLRGVSKQVRREST